MKTTTVYEALDGTRWDTEEACKSHEKQLQLVEEAMLPLGSELDIDSKFYVQHDRENCLQAKRNIITLAKSLVPNEIWDNPPDEIHPMSFAGRLMDDAGGVLSGPWSRFCRIDFTTGREYQQAYYANNPHEAPIEMPKDAANSK